MKKIITILITIFIVSLSNAQINRDLKRAHKYFNRTFYSQAIPLYEKVISENKSYEAIRNLADAYYFLNNMNKASKYYKLLFRKYRKIIKEPYFFRYANALKAQGEYNKANNLLRSHYKDEQLSDLEKSIVYLENIAAIGNRYKIENLNINTENSEFGAIQKGNSIIFAAPKKEEGYHKRFGWTGNNYLDIYEVSVNQINEENIKSFSSSINTKVHESNIIFTKDGKTAYFTRNNLVKGKRKKDNKKVTHVQIYKAELIKGKWKNITPLPFNSNEYSTEHPALSNDEKTLYFASDMPNGFGSFDIYSVTIHNNNTYGVPKNLGATINTEKKEQFPFVSKDGKLYFSSNGHPGFGSLDVFVSAITNNKYSKPDNVGLPINSGYDDFSFNINSDTKEGFFASNRLEGKGSDDIYKIVEEKPLVIEDCKQYISGIITDIDTEEILPNTTIILSNKTTNKVTEINTDNEGKFFFTVACETTYIVKAIKEGYKTEQRTLSLNKERKKNNDASMSLKSILQLEKEKREAIALQNAKEKELKRKQNLQLEIEKQKKIKEIIAKEKDIVPKNGQLVVRTDDINFDYNLWYLRRDTKKAIDKVIKLMKKYPDMVMEVGTHSDIRGNNKYNLELSQKRATAVRMYFMKNDIEPDRITAVGYGETKPIVKCKTEEDCSEEQHELNRRCEFVIKQIL
ncbi:OmpA family protein [Tenacibaculum aiptasiae]|uniref:OmpA family protein n=1 Tax=Tenacibaculum aiptasiae TaxID=426481 RepID=A0A7J5ADV3_9FLAO|nr:OmpA family protein [Tenacibaculum aiptasiae]KAB1155229.1 OmpA family protein [Tenacibaculum aiptasiae]